MEPEGTHEFKRRRYAATQLIKTYGFGPRQFDFLVQKHPEILGRVYGNHFNRLQIGDWRYCDFPAFSQQYSAGAALVKSRSVSTDKYSRYETYYGVSEVFTIDAKAFTTTTRRGNEHLYLCRELLSGLWIDFYTKRLDAKSVVALLTYLCTNVKLRFGTKVKLVLWDQFSSFFSDDVKAFAASAGIEIAGLPPYMKNQNAAEQALSVLAPMIRFRASWMQGHKCKGRDVKPGDYSDYNINNCVNCHNNLISVTFFRNTGDTATYLQAASAGKEEVVTVHQFFAPCMSQSIDDPKTYDSKNLASFYLTTSHYCPIKVHGLDTHTGGVREENVSIILQQ